MIIVTFEWNHILNYFDMHIRFQNNEVNSRETVRLTECDTSLLFIVVPLQVYTPALAEVRPVNVRLVVAFPLHDAL